MIKNDYRRALIMLRPNVQGYSGHVRLERRTLIGSMYFIVNTPDVGGDFRAALVGRKNCDYYVAPIGELRRDSRGQAGLPYSFDPRNIGGRELEDYQLVAVIRVDDGVCQLVLTGNLNGSCDINFSAVQRAVCETYAGIPEPAYDLPPRPENRPVNPAPPVIRPPQNIPQDDSQIPAPPIIPEGPAIPERPSEPAPDNPQTPAPPVIPEGPAIPDLPGTQDPAADPGIPAEPIEDPNRPMVIPAQSSRIRPSAADLLGVDTDEPWAAAIEGLRSLFENEPAESAFEEDDFVYVRAPLPGGGGYEYALIGLHEDDGRIDAVRYAIPARYSPEPPAGLESYIWVGGAGDGWWVFTADPQTGEPLQNFDD